MTSRPYSPANERTAAMSSSLAPCALASSSCDNVRRSPGPDRPPDRPSQVTRTAGDTRSPRSACPGLRLRLAGAGVGLPRTPRDLHTLCHQSSSSNGPSPVLGVLRPSADHRTHSPACPQPFSQTRCSRHRALDRLAHRLLGADQDQLAARARDAPCRAAPGSGSARSAPAAARPRCRTASPGSCGSSSRTRSRPRRAAAG